MIAEAGHFALILAFGFAVLLAVIPLIGAWMNDGLWMRMSKPLALGLGLMTFLAFLALTLAFLQDDFSVVYVASHSNSLLPWYYKISAVWGGHEGSLLLWVLTLTGWTVAVAKYSRSLPLDMYARVLAILGVISVGFFLFILLTSNPFDRYLPMFPEDGADLNPLLQDFGLIVHPPMLYMGYVGFSVAFAFAIAALMGGRLDATWARWSRPWTTVAWAFLTLGIALGSWWAYYELGWGGWWFWDPVENASLMPWLAGTALMHSLAVTEKRGVFKSWTVLLAIMTFSLSLLGTFLVRSGILTSVHAFASDPERGRFILMLLMISIGGSLLLYALRAPVVRSTAQFSERSREVFMLLNNILLVVATLTVLIGTLFPLLAEYQGYEVSVGAPYFNTMFSFLAPATLLIMGVGVYSRWKDTSFSQLLGRTPLLLAVSLPLSILVPWWMGAVEPLAVVGIFIAAWLATATLHDLLLKARFSRGVIRGVLSTPRSFRGMVLGHLGLAVTVVGATLVSHYSIERDVRMTPGTSVMLGNYRFEMTSLDRYQGPNFISDRAIVAVFKDGERVDEMVAEKRRYVVSGNIMTEAGIDAGLFRDLYFSLGEPVNDKGAAESASDSASGSVQPMQGPQAWAVRVQIKPFVRWLWLGSILMAWGGFLAIADRRYRLRKTQQATASPSAPTTSAASLPAEGQIQ